MAIRVQLEVPKEGRNPDHRSKLFILKGPDHFAELTLKIDQWIKTVGPLKQLSENYDFVIKKFIPCFEDYTEIDADTAELTNGDKLKAFFFSKEILECPDEVPQQPQTEVMDDLAAKCQRSPTKELAFTAKRGGRKRRSMEKKQKNSQLISENGDDTKNQPSTEKMNNDLENIDQVTAVSQTGSDFEKQPSTENMNNNPEYIDQVTAVSKTGNDFEKQPSTENMNNREHTDQATAVIGSETEYICGMDSMYLANGEAVTVQVMKGDGDCLFAALTLQLQNTLRPYSNSHILAMMAARERVVSYIKGNMDFLMRATLLDHISSSPLYYSGSQEEQIQAYIDNLESGIEWGGHETICALSKVFGAKISVYHENGRVSHENEGGQPHIKLAYRRTINERNHFDIVVSSECSDEDPFSSIRKYFSADEWNGMSILEKKQKLNTMERYATMKQAGLNMKLPSFMEPPKETKRTQKAVKTPKTVAAPKRRSTRLPKRVASPVGLPDSPPPKRSATPQGGSPNLTSLDLNKQRRAQQQKTRLIGQILTRHTPLPNFSGAALQQLNLPAHKRDMRPILRECKFHIKSITGDLYPTKAEYMAFCSNIVEKYPLMASQTATQPWVTFKKSLSASIRGERSYCNNKKPHTTKAKQQVAHGDVIMDWVEDPSPLSNNNEELDEELRATTDRKRIAELLRETTQSRCIKTQAMTEEQVLVNYPHLKDPEMLILDFLLRKQMNYNNITENLEKYIKMLSKYYEMPCETEMEKVELLMEVHKYFLSPQVKKGAKPVVVVQDTKDGIQSLQSSTVQAPFLVIHSEDLFHTGEKVLKSASILYKGQILTTMTGPEASKAYLGLLAYYSILSIEYPYAYMQFLRAIEKILTDSVAPSKYGNTKVKFERFIAMINQQEDD